MNLLIPMGSSSKFFPSEEFCFPKPLIEVMGKPIIERVIENLTKNLVFNKVIYIVREDECNQFNLDYSLKLISPINSAIVKIKNETEGALCSALFSIDQINDNQPLIIANSDQIFIGGIASVVESFLASENDAACITFDSVHPRWSYVKANAECQVLEAAEKRPISRNAIAGIYLYKKGSEFINAAFASIKRGAKINGSFFIAPVFNELILAGKIVVHYPVSNQTYHSFYSPQKISEFELFLKDSKIENF